ncbi:ATP-binding cassette transporter isoform B [Micractinium conductrix]|uniref:ATP-binding cassette transporter isoform B n=1 Tax=Micractinium conductrix TaxID=554055 RepID=A0A2P6V5L7_9CHLO|nr:ATP-binding cassette transporter isoform B [Micractinium conductrix]|eukprot:PSC69376.1 ATP-binding cassette transporter isoform B [Micractinium conductrix]
MDPEEGLGGGQLAPAAVAAGLPPPPPPNRNLSRGNSTLNGTGGKERLQRLRTVSFKNKDGGVTSIDAKKLSRAHSKALLESMLPDPDAEQGVILQRIQARLARVGMASPSIEVRYEDLSVSTTALVGDKQIPTVVRSVKGVFKSLAGGGGGQRPLSIIKGASGVLRPGRFTLVLAPPGSGKTTLLRALSGRLREQKDLQISGKILYNGHSFDEFVPERSAAYISQVDLHYGELTVRETFEFAAECQSRSYARELLSELHEREEGLGIVADPDLDAFMKAQAFGGRHSLAVELLLHMLGLEGCADTVVGNQMLRGISGGQKKRVTSGEALVGHAKVLYADEISTGLDSNTTFQITKSLRNACHTMNATMLVALLQPSPETYELFDDVMLLASGMVLYHGPREGVMPFFRSHLGFDCPARKGVADFLQEVALPSDQQKYWADNIRPYKYVTAQAIRSTFWESEAAEGQRALLAAPPATEDLDDERSALTTHKYGASYWRLVRSNFLRAWRLQLRSKLFMYVRIFQVCLMAFVVATCYLNVGKDTLDNGNILMGASFYSLIFMLIGGTVEMHLITERLPVFWKQREMRFFPGWCFALPSFLFRLPYALLDATLWSLITYWAVGFDDSWRFLIFWLFMFITCAWACSLFQAVAAVCRTDTISSAVGSFMMLVFMTCGGFLMVKTSIPDWWIAAYWSNPWAYITQALAVNEFTGESWNKPNPDDPDNPLTLGEQILVFRGFGTEYWWVWVALGASLASIVINVVIFILAATFLMGPKTKPVISEETLEELDINREAAPKALPASVVKDIEAGAKRSASTQALNEMAKSRVASYATGLNELGNVPAAAANGHANGHANGEAGHANSLANGVAAVFGAAHGTPGGSPKKDLPGASPLSKTGKDDSVRSKLPFEPLAVTFKGICYDVPRPKSTIAGEKAPHDDEVPDGTLRLLRNVSGAFRPGVLTALMGASGAGKSTLMDVLAGRKTGGVTSGEIHVNGFPKNQKTFARVMGYCEQEDVHLPQATVAEALAFSATLRLPSTVSQETRTAFIEEVLELTELDRLRNAHIGELGVSGLSVEQRKRLTIAVELVANPSVVFMDEPTTGLDARAASLVMSTVRATVNTGRTVVCTIHQPSLDIFEAFDELLVLKPGGVCVYFGPLGWESERLIAYFQAIPCVAPCPAQYNPANWMLEQTSPAFEHKLGIDFGEVYKASSVAKEMDAITEAAHQPPPGATDLTFESLAVHGPLYQYWVLLKRFFQMYNRLPDYQLVRLAVTLLVAFVFGSIAWGQGGDSSTLTGVLNIAGMLFSSTLFVGFTNAMSVQHTTEVQRRVFYREHAAGMYGPLPFAIAQGNVEIPYLAVQCVIYSCIVYWMVGFAAEAAKFFWFVFIFGLTLMIFTAYGIMGINLTPDKGLAGLFTSFFFGFWNLLCGFLIPASAIPGWWIWCYWINPLSYTLYGLIVSQLGDIDTDIQLGVNTMSVSAFLEERFGYKYSMLWPVVGIQFAFLFTFRATSIAALKLLNFQRR